MTAATVLLPSDLYAARGMSLPGQTAEQWSEAFRALGGARCNITRPRGVPMGEAPAVMHVAFEGSDEALAYVITCATA
jgi:hypothetical protein